jgi:hypothetical protein
MLKVFTLGAVAALSLSTGASAQLFGGAFGDNTLGPEFVITFAADGSITTALNSVYSMDPGPYDGADDTYFGVINNTTHAITNFGLSSSTQDIGGFDGDGIDAYGATPNATDAAFCGTGISLGNCNYGGEFAFFTNNDSPYMSLTVNFLGGIAANGGTGYFSLEEAVSLSAPPVITPGTPEASTWAMMLLGFAGYRKARAVKALSAA